MHIHKPFLEFIMASLILAPRLQAIEQSPIANPALIKSQTALSTLALVYSNVYIHELGHKYTAKWLTGAQSTISIGIFAGYANFDPANWKILNKNPKAAILTFLAGPAAGFLAGLGVFAAASLLDKNSLWHHEIEHNGRGLMLMNLINIIPFWWGNFQSDGYRIWDTYTKMKNGEYEKKERLSALSPSSISEQFPCLKKKQPLFLLNKEQLPAKI